MSIASVTKLLPKPARPEGASAKFGWAEVEGLFGHGLPSDYKAFIEEYGAGCLGGFVWILSPFAEELGAQLGRQSLARLEHLALLGSDSRFQMETSDPVVAPLLAKQAERRAALAAYPPRGQKWIAWAVLGDGGALYWLGVGAPDRWKVVYLGPPGEDGICPMPVELGGSTSAVLAALLSGKSQLPGAPEGFPGAPLGYVPVSKKKPPKWKAPAPVPVNKAMIQVVKLKKHRR
ncbi:hypothetical protein [Polyangium fumosum]|uniref:SMI1/KNR4 family protein n=1 Tax=Polyangium fumosum TaxID=889272 RepID=A0A4U1JJT3_9BACT|nr:hypothetical protein [Polyangium fumosum]TKD12249.1 hypothetical protein E8A74_03840 [Polyangium fumosum]